MIRENKKKGDRESCRNKPLAFLIFLFIGYGISIGQQNKIDSLLSLTKKDKEDTNKVNHLNKLSQEYLDLGDYDSTSHYGNDALQLAQQLNFKRGIGFAYNTLGIIYMIQGNYPEALKNQFASLRVMEELGNKKGIGNAYRGIGTIYMYQGNYPDALKNHLATLKIMKELENKRGEAQSYNVIGAIYMYQGNYSDALKNHYASLEIMKKIGNKQGTASSYNNIGIIYSMQADYPNALKNYFASLKIKEELGDKEGIATSSINLGATNIKIKKFSEANKYLNTALIFSKEIRSKDRIKETYSNLAKLDSAQGNYKSAYENYKMYTIYKDSLINEESIQKSERAKNQYEFDKKESVLREQQEKERAVAEEKSRKQKIIIWSVVGGLSLVILFAGFIFRSLRITRKQKSIIEVQKTEVEKSKHIIEEKNKDITDSINYAKRIQKAMLPHRRDIWAAFTQSFVLFKPKDIVSGDFYFFHKKNEFAFIAACDCTGHGVPGAFMSMVGSDKLEDAVSESSDTSEILSLLNKGIKTTLKQSDSNESTRDGMDIALCSVDIDNRVVKYAGANRPIWIIRNGQTTVEEIKATKKAIGGFTEDNQHFDSHKIKLQQGDTFYLSTDGFADTFSGKGSKKLTTKKFKEILLDIQYKTMKEQGQHLGNFIENWKAGTEQVDDILVIGVRL